MILATGIYLVADTPALELSDFFVCWGFLAIVVLLGVSHGFLLPATAAVDRGGRARGQATPGDGPVEFSAEFEASRQEAADLGACARADRDPDDLRHDRKAVPLESVAMDRRGAPDRDVRLRGRRPHGPARVPRLACRRRTSSTSATRANFPYGTKTAEELRALVGRNTEMLLERGAKLLIIACNSATSAGADDAPRDRRPRTASRWSR